MLPLLTLLKNPFTKLIFEKSVGAISHKLKKDAIIKQKELDHANNVDIQSLKSADQTWRDEWLCIAFSLLLLAHFVPQFQDSMERGWLILEHASDYFWIIILTIVGGSFGSSGITKFIKNKKK